MLVVHEKKEVTFILKTFGELRIEVSLLYLPDDPKIPLLWIGAILIHSKGILG